MRVGVVITAAAGLAFFTIFPARAQQSVRQQGGAIKRESTKPNQSTEGAKAGSGKGFDTRSQSTTVKGQYGSKPNPSGQKASEYHPSPKTSKPLDKGNVPSPRK